MVMELLGPNIEALLEYFNRSFSDKTVLMLAEQMISRIESVHLKNYIHRDIKPENFLVGTEGSSNMVYILDFGLAKKFRDSKTHQHIPYKESRMLTGTARYASINNHLGVEQSRRDDLEALGYTLVYLARGNLPWQGVKAKSKQKKHEKILSRKMGTPVEYLCGQIYPEFSVYLHYCKGLKFEDRPDYGFLKTLFAERMEREGFEFDLRFDWVTLDPKKSDILTSKNLVREEVKSQAGDGKKTVSTFAQKAAEEVKEQDESAEVVEDEQNEEESGEDDEKKQMKKKIERVFKQLHELGKHEEPENEEITLREAFNEVCIFTLISHSCSEKESIEEGKAKKEVTLICNQ
eukprot:TRINITY_DN9510_c0_g4_i1.p2 TRINITY_DN9510_c0_g4~~TRINITY_DN9510_c0_g4_i1.p2  ORF type:complete len:348 (-),score=108.02 TRINITY_DN9510_c0_g4_i1:176-1219(-)